MDRQPRHRTDGTIDRRMLWRAWGLLGGVSAVLVLGWVLPDAARRRLRLGDPVGEGSPLHHVWLEATTMSFLGIVACQIGTAFASRTQYASLCSIGIFSNRLLLWGIAFTAAVFTLPPLQHMFGTAVPPLSHLVVLSRSR